MRRFLQRDLVTRAAFGLALVAAGACDAPADPQGGSGATGTTPTTPTVTTPVGPACKAVTVVPKDARFSPTSGPARAKFELVAATPEVVIASTGTGLHRSKDGGETWSLVSDVSVRGQRIRALAALGGEVFATTDTAIHRTTDGGETWTDVSSASCVAPTYLSVHGDHLYALDLGKPFEWDAPTTTWKPIPADDQFFDVIESDGNSLYCNSIYDPGVVRYSLEQPNLGWTPVAGLPEWGYRAFAFQSGHGVASNANKLFQSVDDGASWKSVGSGFEASDLLVAGDSVFAATSKGLKVSADKGATWTTAFDATFLYAPFALASNGKHVFAATDGLRRAALGSNEWSRLHILADYITMLFPTDKSLFSFSTSGIQRTTDGGASWNDTSVEASSAYYWGTPFVRHGGKVFGLGSMKSLIVSTDDGATFTPIELPKHVVDVYRTPSLLASIDGELILGTFEGAGLGCSNATDVTMTLYRSTDDGLSWSAGENNLPKLFTDCYGVSTPPAIRTLVQHKEALFATSWHDGAFRSVDDGFSWQWMGKYQRFLSVGDAVLAVANEGGLVRSTDAGASWSPSGLDGLEVRALVAADALVFASAGATNSADGAIYVSSDAGVTWTRVDTAFDARVETLAWQGGRLFAGTRDQSVWSLELACAN